MEHGGSATWGGLVAEVVRAALVQTSWTGDKESMIKAHEDYARQAAAAGARGICFQEIFYAPYFSKDLFSGPCFSEVQDTEYCEYAEAARGPTTGRFAAVARDVGMVMILLVYE